MKMWPSRRGGSEGRGFSTAGVPGMQTYYGYYTPAAQYIYFWVVVAPGGTQNRLTYSVQAQAVASESTKY